MKCILDIKGRWIIDSRGTPTLEVDVILEDDVIGTASVPSGASRGKYEALELRDGEKEFFGKGVKKAIEIINDIVATELIGKDVFLQEEIDETLINADGTENKSKLGANTILAVSLACCRAASNAAGIPLYRYIGGMCATTLPVPFFNVINGGVHADTELDIQEFMIVPSGFSSFSQSIQAASEIIHALKSRLKKKGYSTAVGDEGGFAPNMKTPEEALDVLMDAVKEAGYKIGEEVYLAMDVAASHLFEDGVYHLRGVGKSLDKEALLKYYTKLIKNYPIVSIEDPFSQDDWDGWSTFTKEVGEKIQVLGDDIFVTNPKRIKEGIQRNAANALLIKVNQIGTFTETKKAFLMAKEAGWESMISHRSGETEDTFIADLAVGLCVSQIKAGSLCRSERVAKYNRLLRIEEELGKAARFATPKWQKR